MCCIRNLNHVNVLLMVSTLDNGLSIFRLLAVRSSTVGVLINFMYYEYDNFPLHSVLILDVQSYTFLISLKCARSET